MKYSVYCTEGTIGCNGELYSYVVLNYENDFRPALINSETGNVVKWLGRKCKSDVAPRRRAINAYLEAWEDY